MKLAEPSPNCPACGSYEVTQSRSRSIWDWFADNRREQPYRCLACWHRFYWTRPIPQETPPESTAPKL